MNNQTQTTDDSPLWPGYSEMLRGTMGRPPMKMETDLQKRALREWTEGQIKNMALENDDLTSELQSKATQIVDMMWERSVPVQATRDITDLTQKIENLKEIDSSKFADRIQEFEQEVKFPFYLLCLFLSSNNVLRNCVLFLIFFKTRYQDYLVSRQIKQQMMNIHLF